MAVTTASELFAGQETLFKPHPFASGMIVRTALSWAVVAILLRQATPPAQGPPPPSLRGLGSLWHIVKPARLARSRTRCGILGNSRLCDKPGAGATWAQYYVLTCGRASLPAYSWVRAACEESLLCVFGQLSWGTAASCGCLTR